ncbi:MAG: hypothetical protein D6819_05070 [Gammaproteobacteria bacterium]|nr:MAG: hypothetical protein D6819_05070 [Gammaproteobacteria bacterium]
MRYLLACLALFASLALAEEEPTLVVVAEGLSDAHFYKDRRVAYDEAMKDAKRQVLEKAVGAYVDSSTLVANYQTISDTIYTRYAGFIKRIIKVVDGGVQPDGFYHVWIKAEVSTRPLEESLAKLSRAERIGLIKQHGNPTFAVNIQVVSDENDRFAERCEVCETEIANRLQAFGYRLVDWERVKAEIKEQARIIQLEQNQLSSAKYAAGKKPVDILIEGKVRLRKSPEVEIAGMKVRTTILAAWSVRAVDLHTNDIIFSRNFRPRRHNAFNDDEEAILEVGRRIGELFASDVFKNYVAAPTRRITLAIRGIQDRRLAQDLKRDLLSARSITGVRFKEFYRGAEAIFDIDYVGTREEFATFLNRELLAALNRKYGEGTFEIVQERGDYVQVQVTEPDNVTRDRLLEGPPLSLTVAPPARVKQVVKSQKTLEKISHYNPDLSRALDEL